MADLVKETRLQHQKLAIERLLSRKNRQNAKINQKKEVETEENIEEIIEKAPEKLKYAPMPNIFDEEEPKEEKNAVVLVQNTSDLAKNAAKKAETTQLWENPELYELDSLIDKLQPIEDLKLGNSLKYVRFDLRMVASMAYLLATPEEIAAFSFCTVTQVRREMSNPDSPLSLVYQAASSFSKRKLREAQFKSATQDRNPQMLKFLGENYLGQNEVQKLVVPISETEEDIEKRRNRLAVLDRVMKEIGDD